MFTLHDLTPDERAALYETFQQSYTQTTGAAWSPQLFFSRAADWTFFGKAPSDPAQVGVVAVRMQRSGMAKLVAIAGNPRGISRGLRELVASAQTYPVWGAVSKELVPLAERYGLIAPHTRPGGVAYLRAAAPSIPAEVFGGSRLVVQDDGGLRITVAEIGPVTKYLIGNDKYFDFVRQALGLNIAADTTTNPRHPVPFRRRPYGLRFR
jgi:hypothetical protein